MSARGPPTSSFEEIWKSEGVDLSKQDDDGGSPRAFDADSVGAPLTTLSGRIEIFSQTTDGFSEADCPGHPAWLASRDAPTAAAPLYLVANQPTMRPRSQLDFGAHSTRAKHRGREIVRMHPRDAAARGISDGDIVRLHNERGACLAAARPTADIRRGVVQLPIGARYDPEDPDEDAPLCVHGNPNALTRDGGTSSLAPACTGQITTVDVERFICNLPPISAYEPPDSQ